MSECRLGHQQTPESTKVDNRGYRYCKECKKAGTRSWRAKQDPEILKAKDRKHQNQRLKNLRAAAIMAYGSECACCGESIPEFLHLDHVENDGAEHRRTLTGGGSMKILEWARRNNYPSCLQLLCHNCGMAKGFYGSCPHVKS